MSLEASEVCFMYYIRLQSEVCVTNQYNVEDSEF